MKSTADLYHGVTYMVGAKADVVLENTTSLDRADDVLNPNTALGDQAIVGFLLIGYGLAFRLFVRHRNSDFRQREAEEAQVLQ